MSWEDGFVFELTPEERMIQEMARDFAIREVAPRAAEMDHRHAMDADLLASLGSNGFFGALVPVEFGGGGISQVAYSLLIEELAAECASTAIVVSAHNSLAVWPLVKYGDLKLRQEWLPQLASGDALGCFALSEPGTGSDAANLRTAVVRVGEKWQVNGSKNWITNGPTANFAILIGMNDPALGHRGITAFAHGMSLPGISRGKPEDKLGIKASGTCSVHYDAVVLEDFHLLGNYKDGFKVAMSTLDGGRIGVAAQAVGIARGALKLALRYAKERSTFGVPISQHQSIANYLAEMIVEVNAARNLTLAAAKLKDQGKPFTRAAAEAKLFSSQVANRVASKALQIHGGYGYVREGGIERFFRDARITEIYEGTTEIQKIVIAQNLLNASK